MPRAFSERLRTPLMGVHSSRVRIPLLTTQYLTALSQAFMDPPSLQHSLQRSHLTPVRSGSISLVQWFPSKLLYVSYQGPTEAQGVYSESSPWQNTNVSLTTVLAGNPDLPFCSPFAFLGQTLHSSRAKLWRIGFASYSPPSKGLCSLCC